MIYFAPFDSEVGSEKTEMRMSDVKTDGELSSVSEKTILVGVNIDKIELETMKSLTGCDKNAVAILSAARQGVKVLAKMNEALDKTITESVIKESNQNVA